ncbi:MAG TPA: DEAD/DEAH box helicase [Tepidisphaeraceae bacterium]|jgi:ATP-dependent RNA helicase RhlE
MGFKALSLSAQILHTLEAEGYAHPTPIQSQAIPHVLAGKDVLGVAQTGTGKTAAFAVPIIHRLLEPAHKVPSSSSDSTEEAHNVAKSARKIRALILSPTRELAGQIEQSFKTYARGTPLRHTVIFGGVSAHWQVKALYHGVDVLVATPGRLLDLMSQGYVDLRHVQTFVLDEADQMLDMGFIHDIRRIVAKLPQHRQTLLFSATMPEEIRQLADSILKHPVTVQVTPVASTVATIQQSVYLVEKGAKRSLLVKYLNDNGITRALVFTRTKHGADKVARHLEQSGIHAKALHGNKTQGQRKRAMEAFVSQRPPILVATDIAARGLDIDDVSHVVNFDVPNIPETYVHRIGRTGRAGASGTAVTFCDPDERQYLRDIERLTKNKIPVLGEIHAPAGTHSGNGESAPRTHHPRPAAHHKPPSHPKPAAHHKPASHHRAAPTPQHKPEHRQAHAHPTHKPAARPHPVGGSGHRPHAPGGGGAPRPHHTGGFKRPHRKGPARQGGARGRFGR